MKFFVLTPKSFLKDPETQPSPTMTSEPRRMSRGCFLLLSRTTLALIVVLSSTTVHGFSIHQSSLSPFYDSIRMNAANRISVRQRLSRLHEQRHGTNGNILETAVTLETGVKMQVLYSKPVKESSFSPTTTIKTEQQPQQPPILFIHGSFHAAWCWTEHYFEYFTNLGYPVAALSLRGTGGTFAGDGVSKVLIEEHVSDITSLLSSSSSSSRHVLQDVLGTSQKPVVVAHSFGGLTLMKYLEQSPDIAADRLAGIITMCSVPPSGNGPMTMRFLKASLRNSYLITVGFVLKRCIQKVDVARELFFGGPKKVVERRASNDKDGDSNDPVVDVVDVEEDYGLSDDDIRRYQSYFARDSKAIIDVSALLKSLPSLKADPTTGQAPHVDQFPPTLVIGANRDFIVDAQGVQETAVFMGVSSSSALSSQPLQQPLFIDSPHDVMLGRNWKNGAEAIHNFIQTAIVSIL